MDIWEYWGHCSDNHGLAQAQLTEVSIPEALASVMRGSKNFLWEYVGTCIETRPQTQTSTKFLCATAPTQGNWRVTYEGRMRAEGFNDTSDHLDATGGEESRDPFTPGVFSSSPARLAYYHSLSVWGSLTDYDDAAFRPTRAWICSRRFLFFTFESRDPRLGDPPESSMIIDLAFRSAIYLSLSHDAESRTTMFISEARSLGDPMSHKLNITYV